MDALDIHRPAIGPEQSRDPTIAIAPIVTRVGDDRLGQRLFVACDGGSLVAISTVSGSVRASWPLPGIPDATFFNPKSGLVHVAIGDPGVVRSVDPRTGASEQIKYG